MKKYSIYFALMLASFGRLAAQCSIVASVTDDTLFCGQSAVLSAFGRAQGLIVFQENFNNGSTSGWAFTQQASFNNPCSPGGVNGTTHIWMGNSSPVPRELRTQPYNFTTATAGVTICFDLLFAEQGGTAPCEGPDEPDEGIYLQYSTDGGTTWNTINYFDPNGGGDPSLINWNNWCFVLPAAAITPNTTIRWFQDNDSGADYDHWGIDNVAIYYNDPTYQIVWQHDGFNMGSSGGIHPVPVRPQTATTYVVTMSNGTTTCRDSVRVNVISPLITANAGNDTSICTGQCGTLQASSNVFLRAGAVRRYSNNELTPIATVFGSPTEIGINVTGLNMSNVLNNSITEVCINNIFFFGFGFAPPFGTPAQVSIRDLRLVLYCPSGDSIILVPANTVQGGSNPLTGGYNQTCFVPGGAAITSSAAPYTGSFAPSQPFNDLSGCTAEGVWRIVIRMNSAFGFGQGTFLGWSIEFNDPELSYPGNAVWSPVTGLNNPNILNPQLCPPAGITDYVLTVTDTANCGLARDTVRVTAQNCCNYTVSSSVTSPGCGQSNGAINLTPVPAGAYTFSWSNGSTSEDLSGLAAGTYRITVTQTSNGCQWDTTFVLSSPNAPQLTLTQLTNEICAGDADGSATITATGNLPLSISWSNGLSNSLTASALAPGNYIVSVSDAGGCTDTLQFSIAAGQPCCSLSLSFSSTSPSCGLADGAIDLSIINGSGNYAISWGNGSNSEDQSNLQAGTYSVTVTDLDDNCVTDTLISLSDANAPVLDSLVAVPETCTGQNDGSITIYVSGGVQPYTYTWSVPGTSNQVTGLGAGTYNFRVIDAAGCTLNGTGLGIIPPAPPCCNLQINVNATYNGCDSLANLLISVSGPNAAPPYQFNLNGVNYTGGILGTNIGPGSYTLHVTDQTGCSDTFQVVVPSSTNFIQVSSSVTTISCRGLSDGAIDLTVQVANPPATFNWSSGQSTEDLSGLSAGTYSVTVAEQSGCSLSRTFVLADPPASMLDLGDDRLRCSGDTVLIDAGMPVLWSDGSTSSVFVASASAQISAVFTDTSGCVATDTVLVNIEPLPVVDAGEDTIIYAGNTYTLNPQIVSGNPSGSFVWSPAIYLTCTECSNPISAPREDMVYILTYLSETGCDATDSVRIRVRNDFAFFLPNAFTPDGDGNNDLLLAYGNGVIQFSLKVFNRVGEKVFESTDLQTGWDGTYRGQNAPQAVYVYEAKVTFANQRTEYFRGSISLLR